MQPKRQIRMSGEEQVAGGSRKMKPSYNSTDEAACNVPAPIVSELAKIQRTFRKGSSTSKALEQTYLFSEGLMYKEPEADED